MESERSYLGLFIIDPGKGEEVDSVLDGIKSIIGENSGNIIEEKMLGKKRLATPISKKTEGVYCEIAFNALPSSITKILRLCEINTDIMRTLIDKVKGSVIEKKATGKQEV